MKKTEAIMEILAAYDLTQSFRDAAELTGCSHHTVARYVRARDGGQLQTTPVQRNQVIDPFRKYIEGWVDESHGRVRADVVQDKLEALGLGYAGSERTIRRAVAEAKVLGRSAITGFHPCGSGRAPLGHPAPLESPAVILPLHARLDGSSVSGAEVLFANGLTASESDHLSILAWSVWMTAGPSRGAGCPNGARPDS